MIINSVKLRAPFWLAVALLFFFPGVLSAHGAKVVARHEMSVTIDPARRELSGVDKIFFSPEESNAIVLYVGAGVTIEKVTLDKAESAVDFEIEPAGVKGLKKVSIKLPIGSSNVLFATVEFKGAFKGVESVEESMQHGVSYTGEAVMDDGKVFLPSSAFWHPRGEGLELYDIEITLPSGMDAVMEGVLVEERSVEDKKNIRWKTSRPIDGLNVVAGKYFVEKEKHKGIDIFTFFFDDDPELSRRYIESTKGYIDLYENLLPPYPYEKFAVVENFLPTGYGMPSFTLLGSDVLRLPFIPATSLGHEFVHNWWGNSVYVDPLLGNWAEALATYTADHLYLEKEGKGSARDYRKRSLVEFANYFGTDDLALRDFKYESSSSARIVGYNKGAFVFHMLRKMVGEEAFYEALRDFYEKHAFDFATWADIQESFERVYEKDLGWFFGEWLTWTSGPRFFKETFFSDVELEEFSKGFRVSFIVRQPDKEYLLDLPIYFKTVSGEARFMETIVKDGQVVSITLAERPLYMEIDPDYDIFRILGAEEIPPALSSFFGRDDGLFILADKGFESVGNELAKEYGLRVVTADELTQSAIRNKPLFILGLPREGALRELVEKKLPPEIVLDNDGVSYFVKGEQYSLSDTVLTFAMKDDKRPERAVCLLIGDMGDAGMMRLPRRLPHLASKGYVVFKKDGTTKHGTFEGKKALRYEFGDS